MMNEINYIESSKEELLSVGHKFETGELIKQDYHVARICYEEAAKLGSSDALNNLGWLYQNGLGVKIDRQKAHDYYIASADQNNTTALVNLGNMYEFGAEDFPVDYTKAYEYYLRAEVLGDIKGAFNAATMIHWGKGVEREPDFAFELFSQLWDAGYTDAAFYMGLYHETGEVIPVDYGKAKLYYVIGAEKGDPYCYTQLGSMYANGTGVEQNFEKAFGYYEKAASMGDMLAYANLGYCYQIGQGVDKDIDCAIHMYTIAAKNGIEQAAKSLAKLKDEYHIE